MAGLGSDVQAIQLDRQSRSASQTYSLDDNVSLSIDLMVAAPLEAVDMIFEILVVREHKGESSHNSRSYDIRILQLLNQRSRGQELCDGAEGRKKHSIHVDVR
jgi:hypothetical protein